MCNSRKIWAYYVNVIKIAKKQFLRDVLYFVSSIGLRIVAYSIGLRIV